MAKGLGHRSRGKLAAAIEDGAADAKLRAVAASALAAAGAIATGAALRGHLRERRRRARRYRLEPGESPRDGIGRVVRGQLDLAIELLQTGGGRRADAVHEARKALKRLRAALRLSRHLLGTDRYHHENLILRDAGRALSGPRDAQALLETLDELAASNADELSDPAWPELREALAADAGGVEDGASRARVLGSLADARVRVGTWPLPQDGGIAALAPGLERIYRRGRRALRVVEQERSTENLHELRKRSKDLWYAAQLLRPTAPKLMKKLARRAHHVSDLLGDDHDLAVLLERAHAQPELLAPDELNLLSALITRRREALQHKALDQAAQLYRRNPRKLARAVAGS